MKKAKFFMTVFMFLAALSLVACGSDSNDSETGAQTEDDPEQEVTYASTEKTVGLSPIETDDSISDNVISQIYEKLFVINPENNEIEPVLAESYDNPDDKTWVIELKEDIEFHDGTPFNAEAVKYTIDKYQDPETAAPNASMLEPIESVEVEDDYTVVFKTEKPLGTLLALLATNVSIVSPTADEEQDLMTEPVGTGPFELDEYDQGNQVTLKKNEDYWDGAPELDKLNFKVVPDMNTVISMLETGDVQYIDDIPSDQWERIENLDNIITEKQDGTRVSYLGFNMEKEPMNDLQFREVVAHAVDRDAYIEQLNGLGVKSNSIVGPQIFGYDESAEDEGYDYDEDKAKELIEENGWEGLEINMLVADRPDYKKMGDIVEAQLTEIGLSPKIELIEWGSFLDATRKGDFDITFSGWGNLTADGSELLDPQLHSDHGGETNISRYSNSEFDELVDESLYNVDLDVRKEKIAEANEIASDEIPWIVMNHHVVTVAHDESVKDVEVFPTGEWLFKNAYIE